MARIRTIKPAFFRHEGLYQAEVETGLPLRIAFAGLWTACDREGRFEWRPRQLKLDCLPYDEIDFSRVLDALATRGYVVKYTSDGEEFGYIPSWRRHQVPNGREAQSKLPEPSENNKLPTREPREPDAQPTRHGNAHGEMEREQEGKETTPTVVVRTTAREDPPAGVVPVQDEVRAKVDELRVAAGVGTDLHAKAGEICNLLTANSVRCNPSHPQVVEWARNGTTIASLRAALVEARKSTDDRIGPEYLAPILDRVLAGKTGNGKASAWATDERAAEAKARELGLWPCRPGESWDELRGRIRQKIARTAEARVA